MGFARPFMLPRWDCRSISACIMYAADEDDDDAEEDEDLSSSLTTMAHITRSLLPASNYSLQVSHHSQEKRWVFFDFGVRKALGRGQFGMFTWPEKRGLLTTTNFLNRTMRVPNNGRMELPVYELIDRLYRIELKG